MNQQPFDHDAAVETVSGDTKVMVESIYDDKARKAYLSSGKVIHQFHSLASCLGETCPIHKPSNHEYRHLPLDWVNNLFIRISDEFDHGFTIDPDDYRYNTEERVIYRNSAYCNTCQETVESIRRYDMQKCSCKGIGVAGGLDCFTRVIGNDGANHIDTSIVFTKKSKSKSKKKNSK